MPTAPVMQPPPGIETSHPTVRAGSRARRRRRSVTAAAAVLVLLAATTFVLHRRWDDTDRHYLRSDGWPSVGQAAYSLDGRVIDGPGQQSVPIASLAKVMTAYLVLHRWPLREGRNGPTIRVRARDVRDTARRRAGQQSLVTVSRGERLTERQALTALLLPSANNVALMLARASAGSKHAFVARMNKTARSLGMTHTRYTDPSGYDARTVSTAHDQVLLALVVARIPTFVTLVGTRSARIPVAGTVHNTDTLLGRDGFVGTKTGSDDAAGGCYMFSTYRVVDRRLTNLVGVVLGQRGHSLLAAGLNAGRQLAAHVAPGLPG